MAGDWIPVLTSLPRSPKVAAIARALGLPRGDSAVGPVLKAWIWAGESSADGSLTGARLADLDEAAGCPGLGTAMLAVGWLEDGPGGLTFPEWDRYNSLGAKARLGKNRRQAEWRASVDGHVDGHVDAAPSTKTSTTEEKRERTEEKRTERDTEPPRSPPADAGPPSAASSGSRSPRKVLKPWEGEIPSQLRGDRFEALWETWLTYRREEKRKPVTQISGNLALKALAGFGLERACAAIEYTIAMGWQGIREAEPQRNGKGQATDFDDDAKRTLRRMGML